MSITKEMVLGRAAWAAALLAVPLGQLHALARFATADGAADLASPGVSAWAEPAAGVLRPLLSWGSPDLVYLSYGKIWLPLCLLAFLVSVLRYRSARPTGPSRWIWRVALASYALVTVGVALDYWTQWSSFTDQRLLELAFAVTLPALLGTLLGSTLLGVTAWRAHSLPRPSCVLLIGSIPLAMVILQVTSLGNVLLPWLFAMGWAGLEPGSASRTTPARELTTPAQS